MANIFQELGIPKKYLRNTGLEDRFIALVHRRWLKSLVKNSKLIEFIEKPHFEPWPHIDDEVGVQWTKVFIRTFKKKDAKVLPLPRLRNIPKDDSPLMFSQLLQYISQTNFKNLWKESYKKYSGNAECAKDTSIILADYNTVLRDVIIRTYGCSIVSTCDPSESTDGTDNFNPHVNLLPAVCAIETLNAIFLVHIPYIEHSLNDCVNFSPALLEKCYTKPLFIIYQLLQALKALHNRSLTLGDITLNDIYSTENLWIQIFPQLNSNLYVQDIPKDDARKSTPIDCRKVGHKFNATLKCENCGIKTYDKHQITNETLEVLCKLWVEGQISNFTYLTALNNFAGRKMADPNCHHVFPWVTDFASSSGRNWRDLKKSKYRLNKGDRQLDLQYENSQSQVPHHVSDVLSAITYYVYMARRTPKSVLCKHVRTIWVPAEYPNSIQRMQEWTPDECIPEFFTDPTVFKSIHDDLDDLEVPPWSSSPEDFIEKHREALESVHVSERLHHWIDLTFGYKLFGHAAVKAKNVCLHLVDDHESLTKSGLVQLFSYPHPPRAVNSIFFWKIPPKIPLQPDKHKSRDRSNSSAPSIESSKSDEDDICSERLANNPANRSPLGLSNLLSRSRNSLNGDSSGMKSRSSSSQRSASVGPKNASFGSHVSKSKSNSLSVPSNSNSDVIYLYKDYKPEAQLETLEKLHIFFSKTFHTEESIKLKAQQEEVLKTEAEEYNIQNAFTNHIFEAKFCRRVATKSLTFPMDNRNFVPYTGKYNLPEKKENQINCNYAEIISSRRTKELQILGCLLVEIFMHKQLRCMGNNKMTFKQRLKTCVTVANSCEKDVPLCVRYLIDVLLQTKSFDMDKFKYMAVTDVGLPPPSAHLLLEPLLHQNVTFPSLFINIFSLLSSLQRFRTVAEELNVLYYFECNGDACAAYENVERTRMLLAQNIGECTVKLCAKSLENLLEAVNTTTDIEIIHVLLPYIKNLIEDPSTCILSAWYLFDPIARVLGPQKTRDYLLESILRLYEGDFLDSNIYFSSKVMKLYHHSFLLILIVRIGLKCFLEHFVTPLVEAVGGYRDNEQADFIFHTHNQRLARKTSHLKAMTTEQVEVSQADDSSTDSEPNPSSCREPERQPEEVFEFEADENQDSIKSLIAQLELNVDTDLQFDHSVAEEALDAAVQENLDQLNTIEESSENMCTSPTIPIPSHSEASKLTNISCEVGSKNETEYLLDRHSNLSHFDSGDSNQKSPENTSSASSGPTGFGSSKSINKNKKRDTKISDLSTDSLVWLSHRLGPVLTAKYLSRNLLKMLTLCYVGKDNMELVEREEHGDEAASVSIASSYVVGDRNGAKVLECLSSIAALYGEQFILVQYLPHMSELISLCKKRLTPNLEGGLISCLALLKHNIPFLSDSSLMDHLQDVILKNVLHPVIRLLGSTKYAFPSGAIARDVLAKKYLDTLYVIALRIGANMTRTQLNVPALQRFFLIFDKISNVNSFGENFDNNKDFRALEESHYVELLRDGTTTEWAIGGRPIQISHVRVKDSESADSLSPPPPLLTVSDDSTVNQAVEELKAVFTPKLAHTAYVPFLKHVGLDSMDICLKNHFSVKKLCKEYEQEFEINTHHNLQLSDFRPNSDYVKPSSSIGSNIALIGNRIDVQEEEPKSHDVLKLVSRRMDNVSRHLRGNWLAYWEHEIGRPDKDQKFNFKQIKLQTFSGHTNSVKSLSVLDNENSFISGSRDKTVKLWSLRSQGDGRTVSSCQWTYTAHRKSILSLTFIESMRLVASCDSIVHIWDPFMGVNVGHLESPRYSPVNVLMGMPAPSMYFFAATTEGLIKTVDARLSNYVYDLHVMANSSGLIRCLAVAPSGTWIAAGQSLGQITVLDTRTGLVISTWPAHEGEVLKLVAVDDHTLISSSLDQTVSVWNIDDGKFKFNVRGVSEPVHCLNVYNNELISGTTVNRIGVHTSIDSESSFSTTKLRSDAFKGLLTSMAVLPLNRLLLLGADNGNISLLC